MDFIPVLIEGLLVSFHKHGKKPQLSLAFLVTQRNKGKPDIQVL